MATHNRPHSQNRNSIKSLKRYHDLKSKGICTCGNKLAGYVKCTACRAKKPKKSRRPSREAWAAVDWSKPKKEIMKQMGVSRQAVERRMRKMKKNCT